MIQQQTNSIKLQIQTENKNLGFLNSRLSTEEDLLKQGLITNSQLVNTKQQIDAARNSIEQLKSQLVQTSSQKLNIVFDLQQKINVSKQRIAEAKRLEHLKSVMIYKPI